MQHVNIEFLTKNLNDLKRHLIYSIIFFIVIFVIGFFCSNFLLNYLSLPLINLLKNKNFELIYNNLLAPFTLKMNLAFLLALLWGVPFFIWQAYLFIGPGLYRKEKTKVLPYIFLSPILFFMGMCFAYYLIFPGAWKFFLQVGKTSNLDGQIRMIIVVNEYLAMCIKILTLFGLSFQFPLLLDILLRFKLITIKSMRSARKFVLVGILIVAAFLTPPDILSQILLAIPLITMYELVIIFNKFRQRKNKNIH